MLGERGREPDQVERDATEERPLVGRADRLEAAGLIALRDERVDRIRRHGPPRGDIRADDRLQGPESFGFVVRRPGEEREEGDKAGHPSEGRSHARQLPGFRHQTAQAHHDNRSPGLVIAGPRAGRGRTDRSSRRSLNRQGRQGRQEYRDEGSSIRNGSSGLLGVLGGSIPGSSSEASPSSLPASRIPGMASSGQTGGGAPT